MWAINKDLKEGHVIEFLDLEAKKPANKGISASNFDEIIGRQVVRDMKQWEFLNSEDIKWVKEKFA